MQRTRFSTMDCPIASSLDRVGEWWSILILRDALGGMTRFEEFQKSLNIAPNMLTRRLTALVDAGMMEKRRYCAQAAARRIRPHRARARFPPRAARAARLRQSPLRAGRSERRHRRREDRRAGRAAAHRSPHRPAARFAGIRPGPGTRGDGGDQGATGGRAPQGCSEATTEFRPARRPGHERSRRRHRR